MNKYRSVVAPEQLGKGDLIQYPTQGTLLERRHKPYSYGYIHQIEYDARRNDEVVSVHVLPIEKLDDAKKTDLAHRKLNMEGMGNASGLAPNHAWAAILAPIRLYPQMDHLGKDGMAQRIGNIAHTDEEKRLIEHIENSGGDERLYYERFGGPREAKPRTSTWGLYAPVGIKKDRFEETEIVRTEPKTRRRKKADHEGWVLDIGLDKAVDILGLEESVAAMFADPADGRLKKIDSLRRLYEMAANDPDALARYVPKEKAVGDIRLEDLKDSEIHIAVVNGLAEPRKGEDVAPVLDLKSAYELVTQRPEDIARYSYMGPKFRQVAIDDVSAAFENHAAPAPAQDPSAIAADIKKAWKELTGGYSEYLLSKTVPEKFSGADGQPAWKMVPKAGL